MALRQSGLPFRRPPATGPLGRYPDRTPTGKPSTAFTTHTPTEAEVPGHRRESHPRDAAIPDSEVAATFTAVNLMPSAGLVPVLCSVVGQSDVVEVHPGVVGGIGAVEVDVEPQGDFLALERREVGGDVGPASVVVVEFEQCRQVGPVAVSHLSFHPVVSADCGAAAGAVDAVWLVPDGQGGRPDSR